MSEGEAERRKPRLDMGQIDVLHQIVHGEQKQRPVWDGDIICSYTARQLVEMGLVYHAYGYWFPSYDGNAWVKSLKFVMGMK